ncbi:hypothetical protein Gotri_002233 [Gossypium trilobum]|uniref:RNase H type-1 domain-containing protein n=1 Tax=Gossypium trilobum TaxID=34281 RepID=A0A7J9F7Q5_9ROSI|nr:hypothetical protein [Gossypium trilobum]
MGVVGRFENSQGREGQRAEWVSLTAAMLMLLRDKGLNRILILTDNLEVVHSLQTRNSDFSMSTLVRRIHQPLKDNEHWVVSHVSREANQVANWITKMVHNGLEGINMIAEAPNLIDDFANDKSKGLFELVSVI